MLARPPLGGDFSYEGNSMSKGTEAELTLVDPEDIWQMS